MNIPPLLLFQPSDDPFQLPSLLLLHSLQDLRRALGLTAGGALPSQRLTVLQDQSVLVIPVEIKVSYVTCEVTTKHHNR